MARKAKKANPVMRTSRATYYSSEFKNERDYRKRTSIGNGGGIHNQTRRLVRVPNRLFGTKSQRMTGARKKSTGGKGG